MTAKGRGAGAVGSRGIKLKGKRTHEYGQQCGDCRGWGVIRELNGNEKKYKKNV